MRAEVGTPRWTEEAWPRAPIAPVATFQVTEEPVYRFDTDHQLFVAGGMLAMPFSPFASAGPTRLAFRVSTMADRSIGPARSGAQAALSRTEASS